MRVIVGSLLLIAAQLLQQARAAKGEPPRIDENAQTRFRVQMGTKLFTLTCPIQQPEQNVMIEWSRNGESIEFDTRHKITRDNRELRMKNLRLDDSGRYECQVTNGFGHKTVEFILQVFDPSTDKLEPRDRITVSNNSQCLVEGRGGMKCAASPPFWTDETLMHQTTTRPTRVHAGGKLELKCAAKGNPLPEIRWFKDNHPLPQTGPIDSAVWRTVGARAEDSGEYRCEVANKLGYKQATFKVSVADFFDANAEGGGGGGGGGESETIGPIPVIEQPSNITIENGRTAQFLCKAKGEDTPLTKLLVRWLKELTDEEKARVEKSSNATLVQANGKHLMVIDDRQFPGKEEIDGVHYFTNRLIIPSVHPLTSSLHGILLKAEGMDQGKYICVVTDNSGRIVYNTAELSVERGIRIGDLRLSRSTFWLVSIPAAVLVLLFVISGVLYLRLLRSDRKDAASKQQSAQPPPPRIPPPVAPGDHVYPHIWMNGSVSRSEHDDIQLLLQKQATLLGSEKPQSPLQLHNSMFQRNGTLDRMHTPHRMHTGVREEELQHSPRFVHSSQASPLYYTNSKSSAQPLLFPAPQLMEHPSHPRTMARTGHQPATFFPPPGSFASSGNYRTLDMNFCRDPRPSLYSSEYTDSMPFLSTPRHDL